VIAFRSSVDIARRPEEVFYIFANVHGVNQAEDSPVLALEMTTSGPPGLGSKHYEVARMLPFYKGGFISEVTAFEPPWILEMVWTGHAMTGRDRYELTEIRAGTRLVHQKWTCCRGLHRIMEPLMRRALLLRLELRLDEIKRGLEQGLEVAEVH
jgi:hypothetical protein